METLKTKGAERLSLTGALEAIAATGWRPGGVVDIGVATGTPGLYGVWPDAPIVLIDPVAENRAYMEQIAARYPTVDIFEVGAGRFCGEMAGRVLVSMGLAELGVTRPLEGCENRVFPVMTLDAILGKSRAAPPYLIKLDTDAGELDIIAGAEKSLADADVFISEAKVFNSFNSKAVPADIVAALAGAGFALADIVSINRTAQVTRIFDLLFVRTESDLFRRLELAARKPSKEAKRREQREQALKVNPHIG